MSVQSVIDEVLNGRVEAYAEIVRQHQEDIWRIAAFALHDVSTTEDLVQQVFVNAYLNLGRYDPGRDFGTWLRTIARNLVRKELRRSLRETRKLRAYRDHLMEPFASDEDIESHEAHLDAVRGALAECREKLSPRDEEALDLRYGRSMGFKDIARALGRTVEATRQMLQRVRLALRRCIEERMAQS